MHQRGGGFFLCVMLAVVHLLAASPSWATFGSVSNVTATGSNPNFVTEGVAFDETNKQWIYCTGGRAIVRKSFSWSAINSTSHDIGSSGYSSTCRDVVVGSDTKLYAVGTTTFGTINAATITRYTSSGTPELFSALGKNYIRVEFGGTSTDQTYGASIVVDGTGKMTISGTRNISGTDYFFMARYNADGTPDNSFGDAGKMYRPNFTVSSAYQRMLLLSTGNYLITLAGENSTSPKLAHFSSTGTVANAAWGAGDSGAYKTFTELDCCSSTNRGLYFPVVAEDSSGNILIAYGETYTGSDNAGVKWRILKYNPAGTQLAAFTELFCTSYCTWITYVSNIHLQPNGQIVVFVFGIDDGGPSSGTVMGYPSKYYVFNSDLSTSSTGTPFSSQFSRRTWQRANGQFVTMGNVFSGNTNVADLEGYNWVPNAVSLTSASNVATSTTQTSNTVTVTGLDTPTWISVSNGEYQVNSGSWSSTRGVVANNDTVTLRHTSAATMGASTVTTAVLGGSTVTFTSTTTAPDTTPNALSFSATGNAALNSYVYSGTVTVSGINTAATISVSNGEYRVNSGAYTTSAGTVNNGDSVTLRQFTGPSQGVLATTSLTVGGVTASWDVTTLMTDTTPNAFSFTAQTGASLSSWVLFPTMQVAGINAATPISVTNGQYSVNGGSYTGASGVVNLGDFVTVRVMSSGSFNTATSGTLDIGGVTANFQATTLAADTTPNAFSFTAQTGVTQSTLTTFPSITVSGINTGAAISVDAGGEYQINGGSWVNTAGTVNNGDNVAVRHTSSSVISTTVTNTLTIGGVTGTFQSTTVGADTTPNTFSFTNQSGVNLGSTVVFTPITVSGINAPTAITVTGGEYAINGGAWTTAGGSVSNNDVVTTRLTASASGTTTVTGSLTIGGVTASFAATTAAADTTPNAFTFNSQTNVTSNSQIAFNALVVSGINAPTAISVSGGEYAINNGAWVSTAGSVNLNDIVTVRLLSSAAANTTTSGTLTIGGLSATFSATTAASGIDTTPDAFILTPVTNAAQGTSYTSNTITISGINAAAAISVSGGEYKVNSGAFTSASGLVNNGDSVTLRGTASSASAGLTTVSVLIGGVAAQFTIISAVSAVTATDTSPDPFSFAPQTNVTPGAVVTSAGVVISGTNAPTTVSVVGGEYAINGGAFSANAAQISSGQTVQVRLTAPSAYSATASATLTVGGVSSSFIVITKADSATTGNTGTTGNSGTTGTTGTASIGSTTYIYPRSDGTIGLATAVEVASGNQGKGGDVYFFARVDGQYFVWGSHGWVLFDEQVQNLTQMRLVALPTQLTAEFLAISPAAMAQLDGVEVYAGYGVGDVEPNAMTISSSRRFKEMIQALRYLRVGYFVGGQFIPKKAGSGVPSTTVPSPLTIK